VLSLRATLAADSFMGALLHGVPPLHKGGASDLVREYEATLGLRELPNCGSPWTRLGDDRRRKRWCDWLSWRCRPCRHPWMLWEPRWGSSGGIRRLGELALHVRRNILAAQLRVALDATRGRPTPEAVKRLAQMELPSLKW